MSNSDILDQLRARRDRIKALTAMQTRHLAGELLRAELHYVEAQIDYRERYGGMDGIVISPNAEVSRGA